MNRDRLMKREPVLSGEEGTRAAAPFTWTYNALAVEVAAGVLPSHVGCSWGTDVMSHWRGKSRSLDFARDDKGWGAG